MLYIHLIRPSLFQFKYQIPTETNLSHKATKQHLYNKEGDKDNYRSLSPLVVVSHTIL